MSDNEQKKITTLANEVTPSSKVGKMFMSGNGTDYLLYRLGPISPTIQEGYDNRHTMYFEAVSRSDKYSIIISEKIEGLDSYINTSTGAITDTNGFKGLLKNAVVITNTGTVDDVFTPMFTTGVDVFNNGTSTGYHSSTYGAGELDYGIYETKILSILIHPGLYDGSNLNTQNLYIFQDRISISYGTDTDSSTFTTNFNIPFIKEAYIYVVMLPSFSSTTTENKDMNVLQFNIDYDSFLYKDLAAMAYKTNMDQYMNTDIEKFTKEYYNRYAKGLVLLNTRGDQFINIFGLDNKVDISGSDEKTFILGPISINTEYFNLYIGNFEYPDALLAWTIHGTVNNLPGYTFTYIPSCAYKLGYASSETIADMTLKGESIFDKSNTVNIYGDISPDYDSISYNRETTINGEEDSSKSYSTSITGNFDVNNKVISIAYFVITFANNCIKHEGAILVTYNVETTEISTASQVFNYNINFDLSQIIQDTSKTNIIFTTLCRINDLSIDDSSTFMTSKNAEITSSSITIPEYNFTDTMVYPFVHRSLFKYSQTINFSIPYKDHPIILPVGLVGGNNTRTADSNGKYGDIFCEIQFPKAGDYNVKYWVCVGEGIEFNNTTSTNEATDQMITGLYSGVLFAYDCSKTSGNWRHTIYNDGQQGNSLSGITVDDGGVANGITALIVRNSDNTTSNTEYTIDIKGSFDGTNSMQTTGISNCNALKDIYIHAQYLGTDDPSEKDLGWVKVNFGPTVLHPKNQSWFDSIYSGSGGGGQTRFESDIFTVDDCLMPMHLYQLGFYGKPAAYTEDQPWFDSAAKYLDETQAPESWTLTFSSTQPELTFNDYTYFTQPLRLIDPFNDTFYMEIDVIDDNIDAFNQGITDDNWEDLYTIDIGIGEFSRGNQGVNNAYAAINSIDNAYEVTIGRMQVGNCFINGNYYTWSDELGNIETNIENIDDFRFSDNPVSTNTKFTVGIGIKGNTWSIWTDSSGTWKEYNAGTKEGMHLYQLDNSKIGIMLYSETYNKTQLEPYLQHLQLIVRFRNFTHMDTAQIYYPDIQTYTGGGGIIDGSTQIDLEETNKDIECSVVIPTSYIDQTNYCFNGNTLILNTMNSQYSLMQNPLDVILSKQNFYFEAYSNSGLGWFTNAQGSYTAPIYPTVQIDISWDIPATPGAISGFRIVKTATASKHNVTVSIVYAPGLGLSPREVYSGSIGPTYGPSGPSTEAICVGYNKNTKIFDIYVYGNKITSFNGTNSPIGSEVKLQCTVTCDSSRIQTNPNATFNFGNSTFRYTSIANTYIGEYEIL